MTQATLARPTGFIGFGLHSGRSARVVIRPAPPGHGIVFFRRDERRADPALPALARFGDARALRTRLVNAAGVSVATVEHLMAAFWICGIDNARVELTGPEIPAADGSAEPFCKILEQAGRREQAVARPVLEILRPFTFSRGESRISVRPARGFHLTVESDFANPGIGRQVISFDGARTTARRGLAAARTFCFEQDIPALHAAGLALGGSAENAVVFTEAGVPRDGALRYPDEPARHKTLDLLGDLMLLGAGLEGHIEARRPGHALTQAFICALLSRPDTWRGHGVMGSLEKGCVVPA